MLKCASLLSTCCLALVASHANAAVTFITGCGYNIQQSGEYHLAQDLICGNSDANDITANDVELHLGGHTITGPGSYTGYVGVQTYTSNVSIHGPGTITGFGIGIEMDFSSGGNLIVNITATGNAMGIGVFGGLGTTLISNTTRNNTANGVMIYGQTRQNTVRANEASGNAGAGIFVETYSTSNLVQANQAHNNYTDLVDTNLGTCVNTWKSNHFGTTGGPDAACIK